LAEKDADGIRSEGRVGMRILQTERYARSIGECLTLDELRELLHVIAAAGLSEREFSGLYSRMSARKIALSKKNSEKTR
jgi:hypothetical protein